ncbi:MAG: hypothetical protein H7A46_06475 [Verrucomicrobiales bacterium]|nr:hypothetical protein [Verrucomicrobiales bacterium]
MSRQHFLDTLAEACARTSWQVHSLGKHGIWRDSTAGRREATEARAERIVAEELEVGKWGEQDLAQRREGDPGKVAMASRLRAESTVTAQWSAARLRMGTPGPRWWCKNLRHKP